MDILLESFGCNFGYYTHFRFEEENASTTSASFPVPKFVGFPCHPLENESRLL